MSLIVLAGVSGIGTIFMLKVLKALVVDLRRPRQRIGKVFRKKPIASLSQQKPRATKRAA